MTKDQLKKFIVELEEENKKLKEELKWYKKEYQHSMGGETNYIIYDDSSTEKSNIHSWIFTSWLATLNEKEIWI